MRLLTLLFLLSCFNLDATSQTNLHDSIPVRLSTFEARTSGNDATLDWKVVCLLPYARFQIQRSTNGVNYTTINSFEADEVRCRQPFNFRDANATGKTFYRIRVGDLDGRFFHSKIVVVIGKEKTFEINSLTPSLTHNNTLLSISSATKDIGNSEVLINNLQGKIVKRFTINLDKGVNEFPIDVSTLAKGNYMLTVVSGASQIKTAQFIKL